MQFHFWIPLKAQNGLVNSQIGLPSPNEVTTTLLVWNAFLRRFQGRLPSYAILQSLKRFEHVLIFRYSDQNRLQYRFG